MTTTAAPQSTSSSTPLMDYRLLGNTGLRVSALSFGSWLTFQGLEDEVLEQKTLEMMTAAYNVGCNFFDTAEVYGEGKAEVIMGRVLKKAGWKRSDLVISTKIFWGGQGPNDTGLSRKHIIEGTKACLQRLQLDYVDIIFCHRPDKFTPIEETVRAMNWVIEKGWAFYWGTSEWAADQIAEATEVANRLGLIPPVCEQPQYNLFCRTRVEKEYERLYAKNKLGLTIWSPLASGVLTGKYSSADPSELEKSGARLANQTWLREQLAKGEGLNGLEERDPDVLFKKVADLKKIAEKIGISVGQLSIAWCLLNQNVSTVITGASNPQQVVENFKAFEIYKSGKLTPYFEEIETIVGTKPQPWRDWRRPITFPPQAPEQK